MAMCKTCVSGTSLFPHRLNRYRKLYHGIESNEKRITRHRLGLPGTAEPARRRRHARNETAFMRRYAPGVGLGPDRLDGPALTPISGYDASITPASSAPKQPRRRSGPAPCRLSRPDTSMNDGSCRRWGGLWSTRLSGVGQRPSLEAKRTLHERVLTVRPVPHGSDGVGPRTRTAAHPATTQNTTIGAMPHADPTSYPVRSSCARPTGAGDEARFKIAPAGPPKNGTADHARPDPREAARWRPAVLRGDPRR